MTATKEQERKALAQIKKIVESLGEDSYIATAFEGCFEIAESNIDNDFADSLYHRAMSYEHDINRFKGQLSESENARLRHEKKIESLEAELNEVNRNTLSYEDLDHIVQVLSEKRMDEEARMATAAEVIVEYADAPKSDEFLRGLRIHREAKGIIAVVTALIERVKNVALGGTG